MNGVVRPGIWMMVRFRCYLLISELDGIFTDADYSIFQWRQNGGTDSPTIYLRDPSEPLPSQSSYRNPSFYLFRDELSRLVHRDLHHESSSVPDKKKRSPPRGGVPKHKKEFEDFHTSNGVRTITGTIGPVRNGMGCSKRLS
jgi:hypothetical protein